MNGADWRSTPDHEIVDLNDAIHNFQQKVEDFQSHIKREIKGKSEVAPRVGSGQEKLRQQGFIPRWMLVFRRLFTNYS